jgi:hypothetical protein
VRRVALFAVVALVVAGCDMHGSMDHRVYVLEKKVEAMMKALCEHDYECSETWAPKNP